MHELLEALLEWVVAAIPSGDPPLPEQVKVLEGGPVVDARSAIRTAVAAPSKRAQD